MGRQDRNIMNSGKDINVLTKVLQFFVLLICYM